MDAVDLDERGDLRIECWYCEQEIAISGVDPCAVALTTRWLEPDHSRMSQEFYCHAECFRRSGSGKNLHVLELELEESPPSDD